MAIRYVAQNATGSGSGADASNYCSIANYNNGSKFTVGAGDTVLLHGTLTTAITITTSGSAGNVITYLFDAGAKMSAAAWANSGAIIISGKNYITIDGGATGTIGGYNATGTPNGILENTNNGVSLGNQIDTIGIKINDSHDVIIQGMTFSNLFVRVAGTNAAAYGSGVFINWNGGTAPYNITITNCVFHDMFKAAFALYGPAETGITMEYCTVYNSNWGIAGGDNGATCNLSGLVVRNNWFYNFTNWDCTTSADIGLHHNGVYFWGDEGGGGQLNTCSVYNNVIGPNFCFNTNGLNATSGVFFSGNHGNGPFYVYDNIFVITSASDRGPSNGLVFIWGSSTASGNVSNNDFLSLGVGIGINIYAQRGSAGSQVFAARNNIFSGVTAIGLYYNGGVTLTSTNNDCYNLKSGENFTTATGSSSGFKTYAQWSALGYETSSITSDPSLDANYIPSAGSGVVGTGYDNSARYTTDAAGVSWVGGWGMGALKTATTGPSFSSASVNSAGTVLTTVLSANTTVGSGGSGGMKVTINSIDYTATHTGGDGTASHTWSLPITVYQGAAITVTYTQPGNGLEATSGGADVTSFSAQAVTNSSTQVIPAPTSPNALHTGSSTIDVSWTDNSLGITSFIIYRSLTDSSYLQVGTAVAGATTYSDSSLASGTTYYYKIASTFQGVVSSQTSSVNATTTGGGAPSSSGMLGKVGLLGVAALK